LVVFSCLNGMRLPQRVTLSLSLLEGKGRICTGVSMRKWGAQGMELCLSSISQPSTLNPLQIKTNKRRAGQSTPVGALTSSCPIAIPPQPEAPPARSRSELPHRSTNRRTSARPLLGIYPTGREKLARRILITAYLVLGCSQRPRMLLNLGQ